MRRLLISFILTTIAGATPSVAQPVDQKMVDELVRRLDASEKRLAESDRRIQALEEKLGLVAASLPEVSAGANASPGRATVTQPVTAGIDTESSKPASDAMQGHNMQLPGGGPVLNFRGFFDFNFGSGSIANPLIFPVEYNGCAICGNPFAPAHSTFQAGEFDLFLTSRLANHLTFLAEAVVGSDTSNFNSIDLERYQLTYSPSDYFSVSAGRFHTAIGYYNTAYHHGNWFSNAEGRPIMYLFEDSGGILPVHTVGVTMSGLVPRSHSLNLHWVAEIGNGRSSLPSGEPVQNFYSDRNYKAFNLAAHIAPDAVPGLQIGGSFYHDRLEPTDLPRVSQNIGSAYAVYHSGPWEFMNEGVMLSNELEGSHRIFRTPMAYTQFSRAFGRYRPYFRYQYVNARPDDPVNVLRGLFQGPSLGMRFDFAQYAAFKLQYNRLMRGELPAQNGVNAQIAFTF